MTNEELLLAMSDLLDVKLKGTLLPLRNELYAEIQSLRDEMHAEIQSLRNEMHAEIQSLRDEMHAEIQSLRDEMHAEIKRLETQIRQLQLNQEKVIMPRLNDIEACYSDTFKRYRDYGDKMDSVCEDVDLLKKVVMDHSAKLQKLA